MRFIKYLFLASIIAFPVSLYAGMGNTQSQLEFMTTDFDDEEAYAYYDLRNRKTYVQVSANNSETLNGNSTACVHIQIFQQDKGCAELNFEDELTRNDTVIYDMDNLIRNDGSQVAANLDDDSYGYVAISAYDCDDRGNEENHQVLLGNVRIIDDAGYEYRMNLITDDNNDAGHFIQLGGNEPPTLETNIIIPFNTVDGAKYADIVGFVLDDDRSLNGLIAGDDDDDVEDMVYNEEVGVTFSVFQFDEDEEPISCDQKTIGCGPNVVMNYGINEDYLNSRGGPLLCEGASLNPGQTHGYISLEDVSFLSPLDVGQTERIGFEFVCLVGLNNGDGTGSMDECQTRCEFGGNDGCDPS